MFGSEVLEVAIGLLFIYLTLSLVTTAATEVIARMLNLRSSTLLEGVQNMLSGKMVGAGANAGVDIWAAFYDSSLIKKLAKGNESVLQKTDRTRGVFRGKGLPSYINAQTFSLALFDLLFTDNGKYVTDIRKTIRTLDPEIQQPLLAMLNGVNDDIIAFRASIETWFDEHMERVSGWYRRKSRLIAFIVGAIIALLANGDTIGIYNGLLRDATLRDAIVQSAGELVAGSKETAINQDINELQKQLLETQLLGWNLDADAGQEDLRALPKSVEGITLKALGIILTAGAVSLGAPFWFDILSKIMSVRDTGKPPEE